MSKSPPIGRSLGLGLVVALGINAAWFVAVGWFASMAASSGLWQETSESLFLRLDGQPLIYRYTRRPKPSTEVLSLDGQKVAEIDFQQLLHPTYLQPQRDSLANPLLAKGWDVRMTAANDGRTPATYWYLIHDGQTNGRAYGVGFNALTKQIVGYFGRQGISDVVPTRDDWFVVAGETGLSHAVPALVTYEPSSRSLESIIVLAEGKLWAFNTQSRQVDVIFDAPRATTLGQAWVALDKLPPIRPGIMPQPAQYLTRQKLVVRSPDDMTIVDPFSREKSTIPIPAAYKKVPFAVYELASGEILLVSGVGYLEKTGQRLVWLASDGAVAREKNVELANTANMGNSLPFFGWMAAAAAPHPLSHVLLDALVPLGMLQMGEVPTYWAGAVRAIAETWLSLVAVIAIGIVAAILAYRRQRRFGLPHAAAWAAFVFVFGIPGWIAYRFHRTWPVLEECPACRQPAPRDRESCLDCGAAFPPPPLKGIEVFA
jgi:hypothetical protein